MHCDKFYLSSEFQIYCYFGILNIRIEIHFVYASHLHPSGSVGDEEYSNRFDL